MGDQKSRHRNIRLAGQCLLHSLTGALQSCWYAFQVGSVTVVCVCLLLCVTAYVLKQNSFELGFVRLITTNDRKAKRWSSFAQSKEF